MTMSKQGMTDLERLMDEYQRAVCDSARMSAVALGLACARCRGPLLFSHRSKQSDLCGYCARRENHDPGDEQGGGL